MRRWGADELMGETLEKDDRPRGPHKRFVRRGGRDAKSADLRDEKEGLAGGAGRNARICNF